MAILVSVKLLLCTKSKSFFHVFPLRKERRWAGLSRPCLHKNGRPLHEVFGAAHSQLSVTSRPELPIPLDIRRGAWGHLPRSKEYYSILRLGFKKHGHSITLFCFFPHDYYFFLINNNATKLYLNAIHILYSALKARYLIEICWELCLVRGKLLSQF